MTAPQDSGRQTTPVAWFALLARLVLGSLFLYMGLNKALHPVDFLKLVRQYDLFQGYFLLNAVGSLLPWFEIFCALLLLAGLAVRGAALMLVGMLIPFTLVIIQRALAIEQATGQAFCAIKFDCGCGNGEVLICRKIVENVILTLLSAGLLFCRRSALSLRHCLLRQPPELVTGSSSESPV